MPGSVRIRLLPLQKTVDVSRGALLQDVLFSYGVEFPCGGHGRCKGCRVRVLEGTLPVTSDQEDILTASELAGGWRLACRCKADNDLTLDIGQWEAAILSDESQFEFAPSEGLGIAVDLGTTTLVVQLVDLKSGQVLGVRTSLNPQARFGSDIMSRVQYALSTDGAAKMRAIIRQGIGDLISGVTENGSRVGKELRRIVIVGNTVMHHLFCGIDVFPLSHYPFEPVDDGLRQFSAGELGWEIAGDPAVQFLPCLGGFVGSDILAGILATAMHQSPDLVGLIDLGTNGEVVLGSREGMLCASTAAGPAFEGARIKMGMQAATGAISEVETRAGELICRVLGGVQARGICGSGLVDAVAIGLEQGRISISGRFVGGIEEWMLAPPVSLCQNDIRELQLAKGAIAAAVRILLQQLGAQPQGLKRLFLAGAFGNYINRNSARRIGLIDFPPEIVTAAGNTALLGAKLALFMDAGEMSTLAGVRNLVQHMSLAAEPRFHEIYIHSMFFPGNTP